jgi:5,10-methenyltetrahydrofolate synthetase
METHDSFAQFLNDVDAIASVGYQALPDEANYRDAPLPEYLKEAKVTVPQARDTDPFTLRDECIHGLPEKLVVFVPGQAFDRTGTRHGRGGGWYDRFLSHVPESWVLVGIVNKESFWTDPISREPWDVPMDWILTKDASGAWEAFKTNAKR